MIKKLKKELIILFVLLLGIFVIPNIDDFFYNQFNYFDSLSKNIYLKKFFIKITVLGDSIWFFTASVLLFVFSFILGKVVFKEKNKIYEKIRYFSFFLFTSTFITGALTQILKHIIGRPRPNHGRLSSRRTNQREGAWRHYQDWSARLHEWKTCCLWNPRPCRLPTPCQQSGDSDPEDAQRH